MSCERLYCGCGTINNRIAHTLILAIMLSGLVLAGVGIGMVTPCTNKLKTCEKQAVHTVTAGSSACLSEFSNCSGAGWRRIIGGTVLLVACALGSFYFCCCAQRPATAWGCCCNCCHHMKQQPPPKPVKMVHEPAPDVARPPPFANGFPATIQMYMSRPAAPAPAGAAAVNMC